jgi:hypothetical protein
MNKTELIEKMARASAKAQYKRRTNYAEYILWTAFEKYWDALGPQYVERNTAALEALLEDYDIVPKEKSDES